VDAGPSVVINVARFTEGGVPNYGPHMLLDDDVVLLENAGEGFASAMREGKKARVTEDGEIYLGERFIGKGELVNREAAEKSFAEAQQSLIDHMEAYFGNTIQFIHSEGPLLIDGLGIPDIPAGLAGRKVLVVSPGVQHRAQIKNLRNFIREYRPAIIGVEQAADTLLEMGYTPEIIVGNPTAVEADTLRCGAQVVLPADPDGHAPGLERIQDLGVGAMTFPAAIENATDLALLLADYHGASSIVNVGSTLDLHDIFQQEEHASPAALLTRTKVGSKLVDADTVISLYQTSRGVAAGWLWAALGILVALAALVVIVGVAGNGNFAENITDTWDNIFSTVQGWFS
jgi:thiamin pyrophosphokinase, catalytic domain protein